jgi:dipeptidyl aminopeptidase/acylaminoacyl peptidase
MGASTWRDARTGAEWYRNPPRRPARLVAKAIPRVRCGLTMGLPRWSALSRSQSVGRLAVAAMAAFLLLAACQAPTGTPAPSGPAPSGSGGVTSPGPTTGGSGAAPSASAGPPSAGRIAFLRFDAAANHFNVETVTPEGTDLRDAMPNYPLGFGLPRWAPNGDRIAAWSTATDGYETIIVPDPAHHYHLYLPDPNLKLACAAWSPDGQRLLCEGWSTTRGGREGLYTVSAANGGEVARLTDPGNGIHDIPGDYSRDGQRILFVRATYATVHLGQLWICNADGSAAAKVTDTLTGYRVSWSPDGQFIVGTTAAGSLLVFDLHNLTVDPRIIPIPGGTASNPRWSPDGSRIVFQLTKAKGKGSQIDSIAANGSDLFQLTTGPDDESPDWGTPGF